MGGHYRQQQLRVDRTECFTQSRQVEEAFQTLTHAICNASMLTQLDNGGRDVLHSDDSKYTNGAVLSNNDIM